MSTGNGAPHADGASTNGIHPDDGKVRVAIVGVGNCANSFIQGGVLQGRRPRRAGPRPDARGPRRLPRSRHRVRRGVRHRLGEGRQGPVRAIWSGQNDTIKFADVLHMGVEVHRGMTSTTASPASTSSRRSPRPQGRRRTSSASSRRPRRTSSSATCRWAPRRDEVVRRAGALQAGVGFVNCLPVFIARQDDWDKRFEDAGAAGSSATTSSRWSARRSSTASSPARFTSAASSSSTPRSSTSAAIWTSSTCSSASASTRRRSRRPMP